MKYKKLPSEFFSRGNRCSGDLYLPDAKKNPPVVIMAHGFGAERTFRLPAYAEKFAEAGLAVFLFDYRCFGQSEGIPRNYVDPTRHLEDWRQALIHIRSMPDVDTDKIALWGTSFSGGHIMVTAAKDQDISAIVAQVPFVDAISSTRLMGWKYVMEATAHGLKDLARIMSFQEPHYVKIAGTPDEFAVMNTPDAYEGVMKILPENTAWNNQCPARILLRAAAYRPTAFASKIRCPALIQVALKDSLIEARAVVAAARKIPKAELVEYDIGHFDIYTGKMFEEAAAAQIQFLTRHLLQ